MRPLTKLQMWILRRIFNCVLTQSSYHETNLVTIQVLILEALRSEFFEDSDTTLDYFVRDCYTIAKAEVIPATAKIRYIEGV